MKHEKKLNKKESDARKSEGKSVRENLWTIKKLLCLKTERRKDTL